MANADQLKALLKSHLENDDDRFFSVTMQVAAHEARLGHGKLAEELRTMINDAKGRLRTTSPRPIDHLRSDLANLLESSYPKARLGEMILSDALAAQIARVVREQRHAGRIMEHGLSPRRKLLLTGPPGTGKTMTAFVLAGELGLPVFQVRLDGLITKFMGETAAKLRQIFDATNRTRGIYFFDEFDAIGSQRGLSNDVGEIRRVLNSFLQMIEQDDSHSLVVAATNHLGILDPALFRRFDDILHYDLPDKLQIAKLLEMRLATVSAKGIAWRNLAEQSVGLSHAEVVRVSNEVLKNALIHEHTCIQTADIIAMLQEHKNVAEKLREKRNNHNGIATK